MPCGLRRAHVTPPVIRRFKSWGTHHRRCHDSPAPCSSPSLTGVPQTTSFRSMVAFLSTACTGQIPDCSLSAICFQETTQSKVAVVHPFAINTRTTAPCHCLLFDHGTISVFIHSILPSSIDSPEQFLIVDSLTRTIAQLGPTYQLVSRISETSSAPSVI